MLHLSGETLLISWFQSIIFKPSFPLLILRSVLLPHLTSRFQTVSAEACPSPRSLNFRLEIFLAAYCSMLFIVLLGNPRILFHSVPLGMLDTLNWNMNCYHATMAQMIGRFWELHSEIMKPINICGNVVLLGTRQKKNIDFFLFGGEWTMFHLQTLLTYFFCLSRD